MDAKLSARATCVAVARRSWIAHYSREPTFYDFYCCYLHALSPSGYVFLLGLSKWTGPKVSCPVGALVHRGRVLLTSVTQDRESCHTRPRLSLLQPFAGARSPFVEAGGFPLEGRVNVALNYEKARAKPARQTSLAGALTVS